MRFLAQGEIDTKSIWDNLVLDEFEISFGEWMDQAVDWIAVNLKTLLNIIEWPFNVMIQFLVRDVLSEVSWVWVVLGMFLIAWLTRNLKVAFFVAGSLALCGLLGDAYWIQTAKTIGFISVAVFLCIIVGIPIGILCGRANTAWQVVRPVLDAMQVVHSFVYMLPFIFFWGIGEESATMVTMVFALPPLIRLTNLGIRQVPADVVEAARAYGASERRVLFDVQIPLARPAIMTGINQTLLLSISMLGIAAIMGAGGLGQLLFKALSNQNVAQAASAGLAFFLVAVVLDRMSQREGTDSINLFRRIGLAWAHRRDPDKLLHISDTTAVVSYQETEGYAPIASSERLPMVIALVGSIIVAASVFLHWSTESGKISAYGRRVDENLAGMSFSGLDASGGSWFGILILLLSLLVIFSVIGSARFTGRAPRWLTAEGATLGSIGMLLVSLSYLFIRPVTSTGTASMDAVPPGTGIGVIIAVVASLVSVMGAVRWLWAAPHDPLHPLKGGIAWSHLDTVVAARSLRRMLGWLRRVLTWLRARIAWSGLSTVVAAVAIITIGGISAWSFDKRADVVITPGIAAELDRLRDEAEERPQDAATISAEIAALMAEASQTKVIVIDGIGGSGLGLLSLLGGVLSLATTIPAVGFFSLDERFRWRWSTITAGLGLGTACIALAWIVTHTRSADPNYFSGVGAFMSLCGGILVVASTLPVLKEFRRSKVYGKPSAIT